MQEVPTDTHSIRLTIISYLPLLLWTKDSCYMLFSCPHWFASLAVIIYERLYVKSFLLLISYHTMQAPRSASDWQQKLRSCDGVRGACLRPRSCAQPHEGTPCRMPTSLQPGRARCSPLSVSILRHCQSEHALGSLDDAICARQQMHQPPMRSVPVTIWWMWVVFDPYQILTQHFEVAWAPQSPTPSILSAQATRAIVFLRKIFVYVLKYTRGF